MISEPTLVRCRMNLTDCLERLEHDGESMLLVGILYGLIWLDVAIWMGKLDVEWVRSGNHLSCCVCWR